MTTLVEKRAVIEILNDAEDLPTAIEKIRNMTAMRIIREWMPAGEGAFRCSECGQISSEKTDYCPHCGADMKALVYMP